MAERNGRHPPKKNGKAGVKQAQPGAGNGGTIPPEATRWKAGDPSPNPKGRPRKQRAIQELIKDIIGEVIDPQAPQMSRGMAAIRLRIMKDPMPFIEYAYGKIPTPTHELNADEWRDWLKENEYTDADIDSLVAEFAAHMGRRRVGAGSGEAGENSGGQ